MNKQLKEKTREALTSVLPITAIVLVLSLTLAPMPVSSLMLFLAGALLLIIGVGLFNIGVDIAMMPIGEGIGAQISKGGRLWTTLPLCFLIGAFVTIAEPDLQVLARQVPSESHELSEQALTNIVLRDQLSQLVPGGITYTAVTLDNDSIVWILNGSGARFDQDTQDILGRLQDTMREQYGQLLWLYVSWIDQGLESVPQGYYAVTQTQAQQPGGGIRYLQKEKDVWPMDRSLNSIAAQLQNFIATGDAAQASALLHENLDANLRRRTVELYQAQGYCIGMLNIILEAYRVEDPAVLRVEGASPLQQIFQRRNINELEELLQTLICQLCHYVEENRTSPASQLIQKIQAYMQENYGDVDLTLTRVADQFNLTPNYLSIFFKENAHDTFLNYLTRLRLEEAKRLMRDTRLSITEISERVGYASANSFTRAFKKIEHVTPTQYRESSVHS